jgi:hypothetical protein
MIELLQLDRLLDEDVDADPQLKVDPPCGGRSVLIRWKGSSYLGSW